LFREGAKNMSVLNGHSSSANGVTAAITVPDAIHAARLTEPSHPTLPKDEILALNIHQRIAEIKKRCTSLPKKQRNQDEGWAFAGHDQVIDSLRGLMAQFGVNVRSTDTVLVALSIRQCWMPLYPKGKNRLCQAAWRVWL
jgi:hypothetical protein